MKAVSGKRFVEDDPGQLRIWYQGVANRLRGRSGLGNRPAVSEHPHAFAASCHLRVGVA